MPRPTETALRGRARTLLEAMTERPGTGLYSIDLPPMDRALRSRVGLAVGAEHEARWTLIRGSSRRRLPKLLSNLGEIDLFIHDSLHTERKVRFEMECGWAALGPNTGPSVLPRLKMKT